MRYTVILSLCLTLSSCSLFGESKFGEPLWRTSVFAEQSLSDQGMADELHYYATVRNTISGRGQFVAYDRNTGREVWRAEGRGECHPPVRSTEWIHCVGAEIWTFNRRTGEEVWSYAHEDSQVNFGSPMSAVSDGERLFVRSTDRRGTLPQVPRDVTMQNDVLAFDAATGAPLWTFRFTYPHWKGTRLWALSYSEGEVLASVQVCIEAPSMTCVREMGAIVAIDAITGQERWRFEDPEASSPRGIATYQELLIYADIGSDQFTALDRTTREVRYRIPTTRFYIVPGRAPHVVHGMVYAALGDAKVYAFDARTGRVHYSHRVDQGSYFDHVVCGRYLMGNNHVVNVVERGLGRYVGNLIASPEAASQLAVYDNRVFLGTMNAVYAFDC